MDMRVRFKTGKSRRFNGIDGENVLFSIYQANQEGLQPTRLIKLENEQDPPSIMLALDSIESIEVL